MLKGIDVSFANDESPEPRLKWKEMTHSERNTLAQEHISNFKPSYNTIVLQANKNGQIILIIHDKLASSQRGNFLLDLEVYLKQRIDPGVTVWHEPIGDRNSLRNLRGIEVKS